MPKKAPELGALAVSRLGAGFHAVGGVDGLYLRIEGGTREWVLRYSAGSRRRKMGLGGYPSVTLAQARERARELRGQLANGKDPLNERTRAKRERAKAQARTLTFAQACGLYIEDKAHEWKNDKHRQQWENTLATYAFPLIGQTPVGEIDRADVLAVLRPIWFDKTETATRVRGRLEKVLDWAAVNEYRTSENPARWRGHLEVVLPKPAKIMQRRHHPAVPYKDVPAAIQKIISTGGLARWALLLCVLTAARTSEVLGAMWGEFDLNGRLWTVPAARMKAKREHRVPLSAQALRVLESLPRIEGCNYLFPSTKNNRHMSNMAMLVLMRRLNLKAVSGDVAVPHGFRSSFRDWAADCTTIPGDVAEMALAHAIENETEAAYRRGDMLQKRQALMAQWGVYCFSALPDFLS